MRIKNYFKAILLVLLCCLTVNSTGQASEWQRETPPNALYLAYQPTDHGLGLRYDQHFNSWAGMYGSASYGQWHLYKMSELGKHVKLTLGALIPYKDWMGNQHDFSIGLNYHWVDGTILENEIFHADPAFDSPWSFELGLTIKMRRVTLGMRTDILRWEPCIDLGIPLRSKRR